MWAGQVILTGWGPKGRQDGVDREALDARLDTGKQTTMQAVDSLPASWGLSRGKPARLWGPFQRSS